jgi:hypothetical protein
MIDQQLGCDAVLRGPGRIPGQWFNCWTNALCRSATLLRGLPVRGIVPGIVPGTIGVTNPKATQVPSQPGKPGHPYDAAACS